MRKSSGIVSYLTPEEYQEVQEPPSIGDARDLRISYSTK